MSRTDAVGGDNLVPATWTTGATFALTSTKFWVQETILNNNTKFLENIKQGFQRIIYWNKYRSEITTKPKNNSLDCTTEPTFRNINRLFVLPFQNGNVDPASNFLMSITYHWQELKILIH